MALFFLLLLWMIYTALASEFLGTVMTYYPRTLNPDGSVTVVLNMKVISKNCSSGHWQCYSGDCGNETSIESHIVYKDDGYCQVERISALQVKTNGPFEIRSNSADDDISNAVDKWRNMTLVELRTRSDTGQPNASPQTTMLPIVRVPVNCGRDFKLLHFDPDGDSVKCRFISISQLDCVSCVSAAVLPSFSPLQPCTIVYTPDLSRPGDIFKVDQIMEDLPNTNMNLTHTNGSREVKTTKDGISKIPVQFLLKVESAVPSCKEGLYLPKFLPPTPEHGAQVYTAVGHPIVIFIKFEANNSLSSELLHNGPYNMKSSPSNKGEYMLIWTPTKNNAKQNQPVCFVVQVNSTSRKYQSELRCVIVTVVNVPKFLSPTPANETHLYVSVNQTLEINIQVETPTNISQLVFSGPKNMNTTATGAGRSVLRWTPSEVGQSYNVSFFVVFANYIFSPDIFYNYYQSEFRMVTVTVKRNDPLVIPTSFTDSAFLKTTIVSSTLLSEDYIQSSVLKQLKEELVSQGLTAKVTLRLVSSKKKEVVPTAPPAGERQSLKIKPP